MHEVVLPGESLLCGIVHIHAGKIHVARAIFKRAQACGKDKIGEGKAVWHEKRAEGFVLPPVYMVHELARSS
ncbi:MAG: hypothetical protein Q3990_04490 [Desulfovibrionaceae bacterium]|nr:hypothetical protein [Desulfovibrionaceae bacterium]